MRTALRMTCVALAAAVSLSCGGSDGTGPGNGGGNPGVATVQLTSPSGDEGAVLARVIGAGLNNVQPSSSSYQLFSRQVSATEMRVAVVGNITPGPLFTIGVGNINDLSSYQVELLEVAARDDELRDLTGYDLTLLR